MPLLMMQRNYHFFKSVALLLVFSIQSIQFCDAARGFPRGGKGKWQLLLNNSGVAAMHMALTHSNTVVMIDQVSNIQSAYHLRRRLNGTKCEGTTNGDREDASCYAHSVEYDILNNKIRPLSIQTDTWSSSGSVLNDGRIVQVGGYGDGSQRIRSFEPCNGGNCDWKQARNSLSDRRWYASALSLPENDRIIVLGGQRAFTYEFVPKFSSQNSFDLPFLHNTYDSTNGGNNLYPFLHLSSDGNIFIFSNRQSILFDYKKREVVKTFPRIPLDGPRSYPSSASSVILPLDHKHGFQKAEVMICGGAVQGAYAEAQRGKFLKGLWSCGRMVITGDKHEWHMENMPGPRIMSDMVILPTGHILIINGARRGCGGWNSAASPALRPYLYKPENSLGSRFSILKSTKIARMYHSAAALLPDGRVLVAGSNPSRWYKYKNVKYPTELRLQAFVPGHLDQKFDHRRPQNVSIIANAKKGSIGYGGEFQVQFWLKKLSSNDVRFSAYFPPFTTHSLSMNQRMLKLKCKKMVKVKDGWVNAVVEAPPSANVAPAGYYLLTVVNGGIPSMSKWIRFALN